MPSSLLRWSVIAVGMLGLSGCGPPPNLERLRQEVLSVDPEFSSSLEKHDELANRVGLLERNLALKRSQVERQIAQLRKELDDASAKARQDVQRTKLILQPEVQRVELIFAMAVEERKAKQGQRASVGRSVSQLRKSLKEGPNTPQWTPKERARLEGELSDLLAETKRLDQELTALNEHVRLLKIKRLLLKL